MFSPLPRTFYEPSARMVARSLLGHWLIRATPEGPTGGAIVETEAYLADDPACHGYGGETARNGSMYGPPGHAYVYLIYGMHFCANAVCGRKGHAEAVLIRAIDSSVGQERMAARRIVRQKHHLTNGPAKLCEALDIDRRLDGADICAADSPLFIANNPGRDDFLHRYGPVIVTSRIGLTKAADQPLRFYLRKSPFVSRIAKLQLD